MKLFESKNPVGDMDPKDLFYAIVSEMSTLHPDKHLLGDLIEELAFHVQKGGWIPKPSIHIHYDGKGDGKVVVEMELPHQALLFSIPEAPK